MHPIGIRSLLLRMAAAPHRHPDRHAARPACRMVDANDYMCDDGRAARASSSLMFGRR
jgi:hypothetical protein